MKNLLDIIIKGKIGKDKPTASTATFNPQQSGNVLSTPSYQQHTEDIFDTRSASNSQALVEGMMKSDPDVSAALHSYQTIAGSAKLNFTVRDRKTGLVAQDGQLLAEQMLQQLNVRTDYTTKFQFDDTLKQIDQRFRYSALMRGAIACELLIDKTLMPIGLLQIDVGSLEFKEKTPGKYVPEQKATGGGDNKVLDAANIFIVRHLQNPNEVYSYSLFTAAINTIAARQRVISSLYQILNNVGFPRLEVTVLSDIIRRTAPPEAIADPDAMTSYIRNEINNTAAAFDALRPDQAMVHTDAYSVSTLNPGGPNSSMDVTAVMDVLNAQNQSALKTMASIIGRGNGNSNTASVEARLFSLHCDSLNATVAQIWTKILNLALRLNGLDVNVEAFYSPVELRPITELEPQLILKQTRLQADLSLGLISDEEYALEMYGRVPAKGTPTLSGTGFKDNTNTAAAKVSPNSDPLGRSVSSPAAKAARGNATK